LILLAAFAGGSALCFSEMGRQSARAAAPQPASALNQNQRNYFYIVGFKAGAPKLVRLTDVAEDGTHPEVDTFYIPAAQVQSVRTTLSNDHPGELAIQKLEIRNDDAQAKRQRVAIDLNSDEFEYHPVYDVDGARVIPVSFGDLTKREEFQAAQSGLPFFAVVMVVGVALSLPAFLKASKQPKKPGPGGLALFAVRFKPYAVWLGVLGLLFAGASIAFATSEHVAALTTLAIAVAMLAWSVTWIASWFGPARTIAPTYDTFRWVFIAMWWSLWVPIVAVAALLLT
jgi:hypothetical protein